MSEITTWLQRLQGGDERALEQLVPLLYDDLREMARRWLRRERPTHTLSPTALVHEAYLKLLGQQRIPANDRARFFAVAGNTMRRILIDSARARRRSKRGSGVAKVPLEDVAAFLTDEEAEEVLALDEALARLTEIAPRAAEVVEHRFFSGLDVEETALLLGVSGKTVQRDWLTARAWLRKELRGDLTRWETTSG